MRGYRKDLSEEEKEKIINDSLPFIKYTAYRLGRRLPPQLSVNDLISAGIVGLLDALGRFEEGRAKLSTFVEHRIRGAMLDELRAQDWVPRSMKKKIEAMRRAHQDLEQELGRPPEPEEIAARLNITLDEYYQAMQEAHNAVCLSIEEFVEPGNEQGIDVTARTADPEAKSPLDVLEDKDAKEALARLISELPEKERLTLSLYYWDELTMKEIGAALGITEGRVCQLHTQAVMRLKARMGAHAAH